MSIGNIGSIVSVIVTMWLIHSLVLFRYSEGCERSLCERYCENGFYELDTVTPYGQPCYCQCCPPVVCRNCFMRKKILAPDSRGCMSCKCGWYF